VLTVDRLAVVSAARTVSGNRIDGGPCRTAINCTHIAAETLSSNA